MLAWRLGLLESPSLGIDLGSHERVVFVFLHQLVFLLAEKTVEKGYAHFGNSTVILGWPEQVTESVR